MGKRKQHQQLPKIADHVSESEDEEIEEDEAFNSEDERKYGGFFERGLAPESSKTATVDSDAESEEDEDSDNIADRNGSEEGDGGQYMLDMLDILGEDSSKKNSREIKTPQMAISVKESEFSASVLPSANLTLDSLMKGLEDTKGFGVVQKTMKKIAQGHATAAPVARVVSERAQRKVHYEQQTKEVDKWIDAVQENRQAETLDFRPKERLEISRDVLVDKFVPTTDFEKQLHEALQEAGQLDEEDMLRAEERALQDDLGANEITMEEYKQRRGQLAKMRALMFYHEQKRHHMNKIKSKKYRRIRKKQRLRGKEGELEAEMEENPDLVRELQEKEEVDRMKERMTLAHKNTSKWARRILKRGKNVDVDTRRALSAQNKRGDELLKKMYSGSGEEDGDDSDSEDLIEAARKVLQDTEEEEVAGSSKGKGLLNLSFMQRGIEKQREKAKEEARQLLLELEANERIETSDNDGDTNMNSKKKKRVAGAAEMKAVLKEGALVVSSLQTGGSASVAMSGGIDINSDFADQNEAKMSSYASEHTAALSLGNSPKYIQPRQLVKPMEKKGSNTQDLCPQPDNEVNPWLLLKSQGNEVSDTASMTSRPGIGAKLSLSNQALVIDPEKAVYMMEQKGDTELSVNKIFTNDVVTSTEKKITMLTQEELVRKAFAAPSDKEIEEEFANEKDAIQDSEDPTRTRKKDKLSNTVSGWGSWTGKGAPPPKPPKKIPRHLLPPEQKLSKRKREDATKPNVIISEKRIRRTADKFMISQIPYPYTSREEYERAMVGGLGREWNVTSSMKDMTRPEIMTRSGKVIQPISKKVKQKRPAARF
ncbi:predicted protein [Phaeodactylum tricornutum CCAP 1055/1]|uniref:U3 small nucleolar RNA-associated protein 14 n=1 Tax=Phaeodactylum tricornutum (strain CCAP 1055/1) TaxID=556484 RepID=B7GDF7_PHATC|nr:predicted protein [Phaeodactylum tricornutum CCAP 1055/1]EEC43255.1 predicted protein [Phaeodactylum tricornutum CCAP 1055/1]|eukprot:XP_002185123.1 predicted protein [Phaeodactylum tricornutum CCAP 1055/1]